MRCVALLVLSSIACGPAVEVVRPPKVAETLPAKVEPPPAPRARATRCAAEPSTVYGQEEVVFRVEGEGLPEATAELELRDEHERTIRKGAVTVPGQVRQPDLPSGDFVLIVGSNRITCYVTVNRELQRASSRER
ncbi:MAG TPA: hypothetical protein VJN18_26435 [Polyangiaceae bacterium]|nr:hypothetical protein [Polyangiaceae bacterium]